MEPKSVWTDQDGYGNHFAMIETYEGEVYRHEKNFQQEEIADIFAMKIILTNEVNLDHWVYVRTVYGSEAYINNGHEYHQMLEERQSW